MNKRQKQVLGRVGGFLLLAVLALFINYNKSQPDSETTKVTLSTGVIEVHFIDVGQGDSILIEAGSHSMLIDAGENNKGTYVVDYLQRRNITKLDYVIGTHPHSDHIGGLDTVIENFEVGKLIMPDVAHTTQTFEELLDILAKEGLGITKPVVGNKYELGSAVFTIVSPNSTDYEDLNDYSVGIKLTYGSNSFLLAGDSSMKAEEEILKNGIDLSADVLKISHHGSGYSSSDAFLDAVNPSYAMFCVGKDNEYGHPHPKVLGALQDRGIKVYRTDEQGTVVFTSDGKTISINTDNYKITTDDLNSN